MREICEDCIHYDKTTTYPDTGICEFHDIYVNYDELGCNDFEEEE